MVESFNEAKTAAEAGTKTDFKEEIVPSLCMDLKRARIEAGVDLEDVSKALRIRFSYLKALEDGSFNDLPGMTYAAGFLRSYSEYLGINSDEMIERLKIETAKANSSPELVFPMPPRQGGKPKPLLLLLVVLLAGLAYAGWYVYSSDGNIANDIVADVSTTLTEAAGFSDDGEFIRQVASENITTVSDSLAVEEGESSLSMSDNEPAKNSVIEHEVAVELDSDEDTIQEEMASKGEGDVFLSTKEIIETQDSNDYAVKPELEKSSEKMLPSVSSQENIRKKAGQKAEGKPDPEHRVVISAIADSWVQIEGANNEMLLKRILYKGEIYRVPNQEGLTMVTGNAGALLLHVDGFAVEALGPMGVVRRNVSLDPESLVVGKHLTQ